ncbi:MAG: hypothetical protein R3F55_08345 [Alphaproteobacteria bacterium]
MSRPERLRRTVGLGLAAAALACSAARAEDDDKKGLFGDPVALAPFTLTVGETGGYTEMTGIAERADGGYWVTGYAEDGVTGAGAGLLLRVDRDGAIAARHEIVLDGRVTQFWWPVPLDDGGVLVAVSLDPYVDMRDGGLAIVDDSGAVTARVTLAELGYPGGSVTHVAALPDGGFAMTGTVAVTPETDQAMVARVGADLALRWLATEAARERDHTLAAYISAVLADGSTVAIGSSSDEYFEKSIGWIARFDENGSVSWRQWLTGGLLSLPRSGVTIYGNWVAATPDGGAVYVASRHDLQGFAESSLLGWLDADGRVVETSQTAVEAGFYALDVADNGDILLGGETVGDQPVPILARLQPDGTVRWAQPLTDLPGGFVWSVVEASDGSLLATGAATPGADTLGWIVRVGADGSRS